MRVADELTRLINRVMNVPKVVANLLVYFRIINFSSLLQILTLTFLILMSKIKLYWRIE